MENKHPIFSGIDMARGKDKTVYLLGLSPSLVNDLQCISDDNNDPLQETVFSALTLYVQLCEEVKKGHRICVMKREVEKFEFEGFYK